MLAILSSIFEGLGNASIQRGQGRLLMLKGQAIRTQGNAQAAAIQQGQRRSQETAALQQRQQRANQTAAVAQAMEQQSHSGFTSQGSGGQTARNIQAYFDEAIGNMALETSINSLNLWQNSIDTKRQAELQASAIETQGNALIKAAKATKNSTLLSAAAGAVAYGYGAYTSYNNALEYNANVAKTADGMQFASAADKSAWLEANQISPAASAFFGGDFYGSSVFGSTFGANIYTAALTRKNNYGNFLSILQGNVPKTTRSGATNSHLT